MMVLHVGDCERWRQFVAVCTLPLKQSKPKSVEENSLDVWQSFKIKLTSALLIEVLYKDREQSFTFIFTTAAAAKLSTKGGEF